jgi:HD-GYP domain-containing protein (c-di-GMP phosphodiesterase class II)
VLRDPAAPAFLPGVMRLATELRERLEENPDRMLLWLVHNAGREMEHYSASHALLVATVCGLSTRYLPNWTVPQAASLCGAALTMNVSMTALQDLLAHQDQALTPAQKSQIKGHAQASAALLGQAGVNDPLWLAAVLHHHDASPGPLLPRPLGQQLARLLQRADLFAARLSPRYRRRPLSAAGAAQVTYLDENKQPDEAGAALIKATGICPPGGMVQLASGEQGIVIRRGRLANQPVVAALIGKSGLPLSEPVIRNTAQAAHAIARTLAVHEVKMLVPIETVIGL